MRQFSTAIFLFVYLLANTELHQLLRLPVFFAHYNEHRQHTPELSLLDFIALHYSQAEATDADKERDQQLPFKKHDCAVVSFSFAIPTENFAEPLPVISNNIEVVVLYKSPFNSSSVQSTIWQPPRA